MDEAEILQQSTADQTERFAAFHTIHAAVLDNLLVMYCYAEVSLGIYRSTLHNYMPFQAGFDLWNSWEWYLDQG